MKLHLFRIFEKAKVPASLPNIFAQHILTLSVFESIILLFLRRYSWKTRNTFKIKQSNIQASTARTHLIQTLSDKQIDEDIASQTDLTVEYIPVSRQSRVGTFILVMQKPSVSASVLPKIMVVFTTFGLMIAIPSQKRVNTLKR